MVQHLLISSLLKGKFHSIVGEEDAMVSIDSPPFKVDDLIVPAEFHDIIAKAKESLEELSLDIDDTYKDLAVFIDPIDGRYIHINIIPPLMLQQENI